MKKKTLSVVCYLTFVGWFIAYFKYNKSQNHALVRYHLEQSLGLGMTSLLLNIILGLAFTLNSIFFIPLVINNFLSFLTSIAGMISAFYGVRLPLPFIGTFFENKFKSIIH